MNKSLLPCLALLLLTACTATEQPERSPADYILFAPPTVQMGVTESRADAHLDALPSTANFSVYGYCVPKGLTGADSWIDAEQEWGLRAPQSTADVFTGGSVILDHQGGYDNPQVWKSQTGYNADNFRYTFLAHYPTNNFTMSTGTGVPALTLTIPSSGDIPDYMYAAAFDHRKTFGRVGLTFQHLLTSFSFQVNNYDDHPVTIKSCSLTGNFYTTVTLNFASTTPTRSEASGSMARTFEIFSGSHQVGQYESHTDFLGDPIMLLPGINEAGVDKSEFGYLGSNTKIHVTYEHQGSTYTADIDFLPINPRPGTIYTSHLNFVGNQFTLFFESDYWEDGGDGDIIIN